jgi:hypothetical protein
MKTPWSSPILNTLTGADAGRLQQVFFSLSRELSEMSKEIESLRSQVAAIDAKRQYGVRP